MENLIKYIISKKKLSVSSEKKFDVSARCNAEFHHNKNTNKNTNLLKDLLRKSIEKNPTKKSLLRKQSEPTSLDSHIKDRAKLVLNKRKNPLLIKKESLPEPERKPYIAKKRFSKVSNNVLNVVDYWKEKGLKVPNENTASFHTAAAYIQELFNGTLFNHFKTEGKGFKNRKFSMQDFETSINNFQLALTSKDHMPINKNYLKKMNFYDFFYNSRIQDEKYKSNFLRYLTKPELTSSSKVFAMKDPSPNITEIFTNWWKRTFSTDYWTLDTPVINHFIICAKKIKEFYEENKNKITLYGTTNAISYLATKLTECFDKELSENDSLYSIFKSSWLISEKTFRERLPRFLVYSRVLRSNSNNVSGKDGSRSGASRYEVVYV